MDDVSISSELYKSVSLLMGLLFIHDAFLLEILQVSCLQIYFQKDLGMI